jgi:hypothetical protein
MRAGIGAGGGPVGPPSPPPPPQFTAARIVAPLMSAWRTRRRFARGSSDVTQIPPSRPMSSPRTSWATNPHVQRRAPNVRHLGLSASPRCGRATRTARQHCRLEATNLSTPCVRVRVVWWVPDVLAERVIYLLSRTGRERDILAIIRGGAGHPPRHRSCGSVGRIAAISE